MLKYDSLVTASIQTFPFFFIYRPVWFQFINILAILVFSPFLILKFNRSRLGLHTTALSSSFLTFLFYLNLPFFFIYKLAWLRFINILANLFFFPCFLSSAFFFFFLSSPLISSLLLSFSSCSPRGPAHLFHPFLSLNSKDHNQCFPLHSLILLFYLNLPSLSPDPHGLGL